MKAPALHEGRNHELQTILPPGQSQPTDKCLAACGRNLLKSVRNQAAGVGANGVVIDSPRATHATVKVLGAALGSGDAERKARAIAIWMPSDTARVREACSGK